MDPASLMNIETDATEITGVSNRFLLPPPMKMAAIDIGTNSIHLIMVEVSPEGDFHVLGRDKDMIGLGRGGFSRHVLSCESMDAGIAALNRILKMVRLRGITKIKAVATSAVREARNGGDFMRRVRSELGLIAKVISSEEEGRLIYLGARHALDFGNEDQLVVDIGGGSMEVIVGNAYEHKMICSAKVGGARLSEVFLKKNPPSREELMAMRRKIQDELDPMLDRLKGVSPSHCYGTSGGIRSLATLAKLNIERDGGGPGVQNRLTRADLKEVIALLSGKSREERMAIPGMDARRVDSLLPVAITLRALMKPLQMREIEPCDFALREGMIIDYIGTHRQKLIARATWPNPRERSVVQLATRCGYRKSHAGQVARLAIRLFDELQAIHGLEEGYKELLYYAAMLHDIGYMISHSSHHKHSYYLIRNGELKGFSDEEIEIIANIARYHRKERPKKSHGVFEALRRKHRKPVYHLIAMMRIANALDRTHFSVVEDITCYIGNKTVRILIQAKADSELEIWTTKRHAAFFEREFGRALSVELQEPA
jgi:exopolyphosphatase/guanosine-5'-triphosphate,3'-diphosphate pyrophosphatase